MNNNNGTHTKDKPASNDYLEMDLLRFTTAGSVDDGKSTLIGRLLYDSKAIFQDQLEAIEKTSELRGDGYVNLALLTDGLRAEREQGITIDVSPHRKSPGAIRLSIVFGLTSDSATPPPVTSAFLYPSLPDHGSG